MAGSKHDTSIRAARNAGAPELPGWSWPAILTGLVVLFFFPLLSGSAYLWEDFLYFSYPVRAFASTSLAAGQLPLWNPYTFNGMPFAADILNTVFYLPCAFLALFAGSGTLSYYWLQLLILLHFVLAGISMFYLARSFHLRNIPALFAGIAYMFTGFMVLHAIHQHVVTLAAWIPLILLLFRRALAERGWSAMFLAAIVLGHSTLCGFPQLSLYIYTFLFAFWLLELFSVHGARGILSRNAIGMSVRAAGVVVLSLAIAAIQLLPTLELSGLSQRASISYAFATEGSLAWSQLSTLVFPKIFGSVGAQGGNYTGPGTYWYYWETCVYIGVLPFLLMILSALLFRKNKYVPFFWGFALFALFFAMGNNFPLHKLFYDFIPGFSRFRNPARIGILFAFPAVLLGAMTVQHLMYDERSARANALIRRMLAFVLVICAVGWVLLESGAFDGRKSGTLSSGQTGISFVVLFLSAGVIFALLKRGSWTRWMGGAILGVLFLDLFLFGGTQNNGSTNPNAYFASAGNVVQFLKKQGEHEIFRTNTRNPQGMIMDRNQGLVDRIFTMEGYNPLALQRLFIPTSEDRLFDLLNIKYKTVTDVQHRSLSLVTNPTYLPRAFFVYETKAARNETELGAALKSADWNHRTTAILEEEPPPVLPAPPVNGSGSARITSYSNNAIGLEVETNQPGFLVLSEAYYPGWNAYVDGVPTKVYRTDYSLRGLVVPEGKHAVQVRFEPTVFRTGEIVTLFALALCGGGILVIAARKGRRTTAS